MKKLRILLLYSGLLIGNQGGTCCKKDQTAPPELKPMSYFMEETERKEYDATQCIITGFDPGCLYVRVTPAQKYASTVQFTSKDQKTIFKDQESIMRTTRGENWFITPKHYGRWDFKTFGYERRQGQKETNHTEGIQACVIEKLMALDQGESKALDIIIIATGTGNCELYVSNEGKEYLQKLKKEGHIEHYIIVSSQEACNLYNQYIKDGKKVGLLFHTTC